jgi:ribosomal protein S27E
MNKQFFKDVAKGVKNTPLGQKLDPGSPRRWEPEGGIKKHNEKIHRESKQADDWKNLPFTFSKPPKPRGRSVYIQCDNCGHITSGTTVTFGMICVECKKFSTVSEVEFDG